MHFDLPDLRLIAAIAATGSLSKAAATFPSPCRRPAPACVCSRSAAG